MIVVDKESKVIRGKGRSVSVSISMQLLSDESIVQIYINVNVDT